MVPSWFYLGSILVPPWFHQFLPQFPLVFILVWTINIWAQPIRLMKLTCLMDQWCRRRVISGPASH